MSASPGEWFTIPGRWRPDDLVPGREVSIDGMNFIVKSAELQIPLPAERRDSHSPRVVDETPPPVLTLKLIPRDWKRQ